jgi:hypothetical protein
VVERNDAGDEGRMNVTPNCYINGVAHHQQKGIMAEASHCLCQDMQNWTLSVRYSAVGKSASSPVQTRLVTPSGTTICLMISVNNGAVGGHHSGEFLAIQALSGTDRA